MGCAVSCASRAADTVVELTRSNNDDVVALDDAERADGVPQWTWREQIWADTYAPGRVEVGRLAELLRGLPVWLPCKPVADPTAEQLLLLKATLAQQWNGKQRPSTLRLGGRARSYQASASVRNTKGLMDRFDPDDATLALAGYEGTTPVRLAQL